MEARQEAASEQAVGTNGTGAGTGTDASLTKVESVEESESPTKPMGRTARIRMSFHSTLPRARSISRSRSKSGDASVTGAGGLLLPPSAPVLGQGNVTGTAPTMTASTSQIRKVMSLESDLGPSGGHVGVGDGDGFHTQRSPAAMVPVA